MTFCEKRADKNIQKEVDMTSKSALWLRFWSAEGNRKGFTRCLKKHPIQARHKQDWGQVFIILLPHAAVLPESNACSDVVKPAQSFSIQNSQTSLLCLMHRACYYDIICSLFTGVTLTIQ